MCCWMLTAMHACVTLASPQYWTQHPLPPQQQQQQADTALAAVLLLLV
jgi:hypothetical protein